MAVVDDLSTGRRAFLPEDAAFFHLDMTETDALTRLLRDVGDAGVVHVTGYKFTGESVREPLTAYRTNVQGTASVLQAMEGGPVPARQSSRPQPPCTARRPLTR